MRKRDLFLIAVLALTPTGAFAADIMAPPPMNGEPVAVPFTWTGFRVGAQAGYLKSHAILADLASNTGLLNADFSKGGVTAGMFAGFDYQFPQGFVLGIEADLNWDKLESGQVAAIDTTTHLPATDQFANATLKWDGSVRARVGYAMDRFMPYITAGLAYAEFEHGRDFTDATNGGVGADATTYDTRLMGWTLGGGLEYAFTQYIVARAEYRYTRFQKKKFEGGVDSEPDGIPNVIGTHKIDVDMQTVRAGVAVKF